ISKYFRVVRHQRGNECPSNLQIDVSTAEKDDCRAYTFRLFGERSETVFLAFRRRTYHLQAVDVEVGLHVGLPGQCSLVLARYRAMSVQRAECWKMNDAVLRYIGG